MGEKYKGFLYVGLMIKNNNPYLIEYNVRMGDPECQTILPLLATDLLDLILSCCDETLENQNILWEEKKSMCVVLCSNGYPDIFKKNIEIPNIEKIKNNDSFFIYHAGTKKKDNQVYANGGRVLNFVSISDNLKSSREKIIKDIKNNIFEDKMGEIYAYGQQFDILHIKIIDLPWAGFLQASSATQGGASSDATTLRLEFMNRRQASSICFLFSLILFSISDFARYCRSCSATSLIALLY